MTQSPPRVARAFQSVVKTQGMGPTDCQRSQIAYIRHTERRSERGGTRDACGRSARGERVGDARCFFH
jgi:hypothetical protein